MRLRAGRRGTSHPTLTAVLLTVLLPVPAVLSAQPAGSRTVALDIPYIPNGGHMQQLDLYMPSDTSFPTILFVHEGSLTTGDRKDEPYAQIGRTFQRLGIGFAAMSYRLAPDNKWPAQPQDVAAAFAWVKKNISSYGGDPGRVFLFGHSSGCLLVATVAADSQYLAAQGLTQRDVAGVIPMGCRLNDFVEVGDGPPSCCYEATWVPADRIAEFLSGESAFISIAQRQNAVPAAHVTASLPPTLILVAEEERFFPPVLRDAAEFVGRAQSDGADAEIAILADRKHMSAIQKMTSPDDPTVRRIVEFIRKHQ